MKPPPNPNDPAPHAAEAAPEAAPAPEPEAAPAALSASAPDPEAAPADRPDRPPFVWRALTRSARFVGHTARTAYESVDPDLRVHLAQLPLVGLTMLARGQAVPTPLPDDGRRPIVCVHGLGGGAGNFWPLRAFLRLHGRKRVYAPRLPPGRSLPELAAFVADYIAQVATVNGLSPDATLDVVAHSMGGLIVRLALESPELGRRIQTLVTLGTPHAGSLLARYGAAPYSRALRPDSDVLVRLAAQLPWPGPPTQPRLVAFWSPADVILLPAESASLAGARNVELPGVTHYSYLLSPRVFRHVLRALA